MKPVVKTISVFLITGVLANGLAILLYALWLHTGLVQEVSMILSSIPAIAFAHALHRHWTFGKSQPYWASLGAFYLANAGLFLMQLCLLFILTRLLLVAPIAAYIAAVITTTTVSFLASKKIFNRNVST